MCFLLLFDIRKSQDRVMWEQKLFMALLCSNIALLCLDMMAWGLDGRQGPYLALINITGYVLYYVLQPVTTFCWVLYVDYQIYYAKNRLKQLYLPLSLPLIIITLISILTPWTGHIFQVDANNVYHRGPYFLLFVGVVYIYLFYAMLLVLWNRKRINREHFVSMLLFLLPPTAAGIVQSKFYGISLLWGAMTLSILMIYLNIQNRRLHTDYLTGIFNRSQCDRYLTGEIQNCASGNSFAGFLMDIDNFKKINDELGHATGDEALVTTAHIIRNSLRKRDFVARYGGDEFIAFLDLQTRVELERAKERICMAMEEFNANGNKPYKLHLSIGCDLYDPRSGMSQDQFIRHIDELMYEDKQRNKRDRSSD
ncbi:MAG: diguanylate cyclase [Syntrophomonas sp.]